jgi:hypothetical protein
MWRSTTELRMDIALTWASRSLIDPYSPEMLAVLRSAVPRNRTLGINAALYFDECTFLQMLEGEADNVYRVFDQIQRDWRHTDVTVLDEQRIVQRRLGTAELRCIDGARHKHADSVVSFDRLVGMAPGQRRELALAVLRA